MLLLLYMSQATCGSYAHDDIQELYHHEYGRAAAALPVCIYIYAQLH